MLDNPGAGSAKAADNGQSAAEGIAKTRKCESTKSRQEFAKAAKKWNVCITDRLSRSQRKAPKNAHAEAQKRGEAPRRTQPTRLSSQKELDLVGRWVPKQGLTIDAHWMRRNVLSRVLAVSRFCRQNYENPAWEAVSLGVHLRGSEKSTKAMP
jgi:hypothetical protein